MKRILIIEDDPSIAELQRDYLEISGYETKIAFSGDEGLKEGISGKFDLILLDLMLPGIDGFEVCRNLRRQLEIPILMVTAKKEGIGAGSGRLYCKTVQSKRTGGKSRRSSCPV